jgi:hypothetical protein
VLKLAGLGVVFLCWWAATRHHFTFFGSVPLMWGFVAFVPLLAIAGQRLLNPHPTREGAAFLTIPVHYLEMILLGCSLVSAFPSDAGPQPDSPMALVRWPTRVI